jgi:hypothetical protein
MRAARPWRCLEGPVICGCPWRLTGWMRVLPFLPMANSIVAGKLRALESGLITLGGALRIIVPPEVAVTDIPLGTSVTVAVHQRTDGWLVAEGVRVNQRARS